MTMGTSQMLTCMEERLKQLDANASVQTFGQEINPFTMGIAVADTMIHGGDPDNMQFGDTLSDDKFSGYSFEIHSRTSSRAVCAIRTESVRM